MNYLYRQEYFKTYSPGKPPFYILQVNEKDDSGYILALQGDTGTGSGKTWVQEMNFKNQAPGAGSHARLVDL